MPTSPTAIAEVLVQAVRLTNAGAFSEGLNPAQWVALRFVATAQDSARTAMGFARYHGTTKGTASQTLGALKRKGLVTSQPDPRDGRASRLALTEAGRAVLARDPINDLVGAISPLSEDMKRQLAVALEQIVRNLVRRVAA